MSTSTQRDQLASAWPKTYAAIRQTYYMSDTFGTTNTAGQNDAGYLLQGLARYRTIARDRHPQRDLSDAVLDAAAAREVWYHHGRGSVFRRACAALSTCFAHLPTERPERLFALSAKEVGHVR